MIFILLSLWWLSGVFSFVYWWTKDYDLETPQLFLAVIAGLIGPMAWFAGSMIQDEGRNHKILMKRRGQ